MKAKTVVDSLLEADSALGYIGVATFGSVVGAADSGWDIPHEFQGFGGRGRDKWRYDPKINVIFWSDGRGTAQNRIAVDNWLSKKGINISRHDNILNAPRVRFELEFDEPDPTDFT